MLSVPSDESGVLYVLDPCAGKGEAAAEIAESLLDPERRDLEVKLFTVELELDRYEALCSRLRQKLGWESEHAAKRGDAFALEFELGGYKQGVSLLFLNPPYDHEVKARRLEEKFLRRFTLALGEGGLLVFIVPHYVLKASAETLAREYSEVQCFRFPAPAFDQFKQIVVFARRASQLAPDERLRERVLRWAENVSDVPVLESGCAALRVSLLEHGGFTTWEMRRVDLKGLLPKYRPWHVTTRTGKLEPSPAGPPTEPVDGMMFRTYPIATPPRPAHIASGIASGLFNGHRVEAPGLPPLLVKGVFDKEFVTIDEKRNKHGETVGLVQVQQPKLATTVLDLETSTYHSLKPGEATGTRDVSEMTLGDLIAGYGSSLMSVMDRQCPILYDPRRGDNGVELAPVERSLFKAQQHAARACVKLLERERAAVLLGEIGSGKTTVALTVGKTIARRMLVLCPPHLLDTWKQEARNVVPEARVVVLEQPSDVEELARREGPALHALTVAVLSRETAKLGHGLAPVTGACPRCGGALPAGDLVKTRARCVSTKLKARGRLAREAMRLALHLAPYAPEDPNVQALLSNRIQRRYLARLSEGERKWEFDPTVVRRIVVALLLEYQKRESGFDSLELAILFALLANPDPFDIRRAVRVVASKKNLWDAAHRARKFCALLEPGSDLQAELLAGLKPQQSTYYPMHDVTETIAAGGDVSFYPLTLRRDEEGLKVEASENQVYRPGALDTMLELLRRLGSLGAFARTKECGEVLFQAVPEPRRFPLAPYIAKRHPRLFDFLVLDEGHEYSGDGTAQELAAHRLTELRIPTLLMTGSLMNGYASSLFANLWALSRNFRAEFRREDRQKFANRYGYQKRILEERNPEGEVLTFGSVTDRVERSARVVGHAPGVLPLLLFRHLLPLSVTLHKTDLALELPRCVQKSAEVEPGTELKQNLEYLQSQLIRQIRADMFKPEVSGKLFGQLAELPSYLDRATADAGNAEDGGFEIRYPESVGGELVARVEPLPASTILPKEEWMLDLLEREFAEGRNVLIFAWHVAVLPRLARLVQEEFGIECPILQANKVSTAKRQAWIDQHVVARRARVLIANPTTVQTGLNNLVHFATEVWMENPACNPVVARQAVGRVDRIGQTKETRILWPVYAGTLQETLHDLLLKKIAVSVSTDGLDPESALRAAGAADDGYLSGLSLGRQLWSMIESGRLAA